MSEEAVACPKCGGRMWDNRVGKKNPKSPDYKCRDSSCDGVVWPERGQVERAERVADAPTPTNRSTTAVNHFRIPFAKKPQYGFAKLQFSVEFFVPVGQDGETARLFTDNWELLQNEKGYYVKEPNKPLMQKAGEEYPGLYKPKMRQYQSGDGETKEAWDTYSLVRFGSEKPGEGEEKGKPSEATYALKDAIVAAAVAKLEELNGGGGRGAVKRDASVVSRVASVAASSSPLGDDDEDDDMPF